MNNTKSEKSSILYVEDTPSNLRLVSRLLEQQLDVCMWKAPEPQLGLELAIEHNPGLILLDINLPGIDGFEVLKQLKQHKTTCDIPVIAVTANAMVEDIEKGMAAGFDDYIVKPINIKKLLQAVNTYL